MKFFRIPLILAILAAGFLPINSAEAQRYTNIRVRPPLIIETPGRPPHRGMVWIPGHWRWSNRRASLLGLGPRSLGQALERSFVTRLDVPVRSRDFRFGQLAPKP